MRASFSSTLAEKAMARLGFPGALLVTWGVLAGGVARADGAFPAAQSILLDATNPSHVVLATNFGLVSTLDGGTSWVYGCETPATTNAYQYGGAAPASPRIWALTSSALVHSDDTGCSWSAASLGAAAGSAVLDYFIDRDDPKRVLAIVGAGSSDAGAAGAALVLSLDGGVSFSSNALLSVEAGGSLDGVEIARGSGAFYAVGRFGAAHHIGLALSRDRGATWSVRDLEPALSAFASEIGRVTLAGVDRDDDGRVYLRVRTGQSTALTDGLAVATGEGASLAVPLSVEGATFGAFLQRTDGTLLVAGRASDGASLAFRSTDRGASFATWSVSPLRIVGLAERGRTLFAAVDNFAEKMALAASDDDGTSFHRMLSFDQISAVQSCLAASCQNDCQKKAEIGLINAAACTATSDGGEDAAPPSTAKASGCGCVADAAMVERASLLTCALVAVVLVRCRRKDRRPRRE